DFQCRSIALNWSRRTAPALAAADGSFEHVSTNASRRRNGQSSNLMTDRMPDFIVAGVARAGTTSLANWLAQHPELHLSPVKETNFFARPDLGTAGPGDYWLNTPPEFEPDGTMRSAHFARIETWEEYVRCFIPEKPGARRRGEASVSYSF